MPRALLVMHRVGPLRVGMVRALGRGGVGSARDEASQPRLSRRGVSGVLGGSVLGTWVLAAVATWAPAGAARSAIARAMPREARVMKRVWPLRGGMEREWGMGNEGNEGNEASLALRGRRGVEALRCGFQGGVPAGRR